MRIKKPKPKRVLEDESDILPSGLSPAKKRKIEKSDGDEKYPLQSPRILRTPEDKYGRSQSMLPLKKRLTTIEKENELTTPVKSPSKKVNFDKVLKNKVLNNGNLSENSSEDESDDDDDDVDDIFQDLKKSGIKAVSNRKSPKTPSSDKKDKSSSKKKPELEKSPDSLVLNYKRTPKKKNYDDIESPSKKLSKSNDVKSSPRILSNDVRSSPRISSSDIRSSPRISSSDVRSSPRISSSVHKGRRRIIDDEEEDSPKKSSIISKSRKRILNDEDDIDDTELVKRKSKRTTPLKSTDSTKKTPKTPKNSTNISTNDDDADDFREKKKSKKTRSSKSSDSAKKSLRTPKRKGATKDSDNSDDDDEDFVPTINKNSHKNTPLKLTISLKKTPKTPKNETSVDKYEKKKKEIEDIETVPLLRTPRSTRRSCNGDASLNSPLSSRVSSARRSSRIKKTETPDLLEDGWSSKKNSGIKRREGYEATTPISKKILEQPKTPLEKARQSLHVSTIPESLPCREKEFKNIMMFLENKLLDGIGGCMYISGVPGTGKTATVTQVIKHLQDLTTDGTMPDFKYIEINGMRLADPRQAYVQLCQKLFNNKEKLAPDKAYQKLDNWFSKTDRKNNKISTVLLVDELDLICTKKQEVVYNILDWPTRIHSRLIVLTIANTMDMPERLFKGRVTSRLGLTRLTFMPYTHKQLEEIILARLTGLNAFSHDAVQLVTRKVAAVSGDARRALDICRRATELPAPNDTVTIGHIEQAIREMTNSNIVKVIRSCSEMEKLFLRSMSDVSVRSGLEEVDFRDVFEHLLVLCTLEGFPKPPASSIITLSNRLKCSRLIYTNQSQAGILQRLTLNVTQDDIHYALKSSS